MSENNIDSTPAKEKATLVEDTFDSPFSVGPAKRKCAFDDSDSEDEKKKAKTGPKKGLVTIYPVNAAGTQGMSGYVFTVAGFAEKFLRNHMYNSTKDKTSKNLCKHCSLVGWGMKFKKPGSDDNDKLFINNNAGYAVSAFAVVAPKLGVTFTQEDIKKHMTEIVIPTFLEATERDQTVELSEDQHPFYDDDASMQDPVTYWNHYLTLTAITKVHKTVFAKNESDAAGNQFRNWVREHKDHTYSVWKKDTLTGDLAEKFKLQSAMLSQTDKRTFASHLALKKKKV